MLGIFNIRLYISQVMKTLIVHPADPTTAFLSRIYAHLKDKTVIKGDVSKSVIRDQIEVHDRVLLLGHGSPYGLLSRGQFPDAGLYIVDDSMVSVLKNKLNCIFIWCYADQFVSRHRLSGLCTGMFISELGEADYWRFDGIQQDLIDQSNELFSSIISQHINEPLGLLYNKLLIKYELLANNNPIVQFNLPRIHLSYSASI